MIEMVIKNFDPYDPDDKLYINSDGSVDRANWQGDITSCKDATVKVITKDWKATIREGMKLIQLGCAQNEGMCNNCPFFKICEETTMKHRVYDYAKWSPENWNIE